MEPDWKQLEKLVYQHFKATLACVTLVLLAFIGGCTAVCLDDPSTKASVSVTSKSTKNEKPAKGIVTDAQFQKIQVGMSWSQVKALLGPPAVEVDGDGQDVWKTADGRLATVYYDNTTDEEDDSPNVVRTELANG